MIQVRVVDVPEALRNFFDQEKIVADKKQPGSGGQDREIRGKKDYTQHHDLTDNQQSTKGGVIPEYKAPMPPSGGDGKNSGNSGGKTND